MTILGLDTSNYRTSIALVSEEKGILMNYREMLPVLPGERGLRQSDAVFSHIKQISGAEEMIRKAEHGPISAVAASVAPRDGAESYMPVFQVGASFGKLFAAAAGIPFIPTTHQRGHLEAAKATTVLAEADDYLALHLSGGTTDLLDVRNGKITQIGGSMDLHAGQLVDRTGVTMGLSFPAGPELELLAKNGHSVGRLGCSMEHGDLQCHLSGAESQIQRWLASGDGMSKEDIAREVYDFLARTIARMITAGSQKTGQKDVLITGGVASSALLRELITIRISSLRFPIRPVFGMPEMSGDNAVGVALFGLRTIRNNLNRQEQGGKYGC